MKNIPVIKAIVLNTLIAVLICVLPIIAFTFIFEGSEGMSPARFKAIIIIMAAILIGIAVAITYRLGKSVFGEMKYMSIGMGQIGSSCDLSFPPEVMASAVRCSTWQNEIGDVARAAGGIIGHLSHLESVIGSLAGGDLTVEVKTLGPNDKIGISLEQLVVRFNEMFAAIDSSVNEVHSGAAQISAGSQSLAQGSAEQASVVEELSAEISVIAKNITDNAEMAKQAANLGDTIKKNAEKGSFQMDEMMKAVKQINDASQSISKIIKVIDDIAFQTNILALNAAVEAARAGQHGKGFAVVAEEVRNLAGKSAEAAKETSELIANSTVKTELGAKIANETAASLTEIVAGIKESSEIINKIAASSEEQSQGITQINHGIEQVASVVQSNSATAEQSASASEEMSGQSAMLEELVARFKLKG